MEQDNDKKDETDILIVPQFSLGGKMKSGKKGAQYNSSEKPDIARIHYEAFCEGLKQRNETNQKDKKQKEKFLNVNILCGIFGNRQGLKIESDGPFTHCFDINMIGNKKNNDRKANSKNDDKRKELNVANKNKKGYNDNSISMVIDDIIGMVNRL